MPHMKPHTLVPVCVLVLLSFVASAAPVPKPAVVTPLVVAESTELLATATSASRVQIGETLSATPVRFEFEHPQWAELRVLDESGLVVKTIAAGRWAPTAHQLAWHGDDDQSQPVQPGSYTIQLWIPDQRELRSAR